MAVETIDLSDLGGGHTPEAPASVNLSALDLTDDPLSLRATWTSGAADTSFLRLLMAGMSLEGSFQLLVPTDDFKAVYLLADADLSRVRGDTGEWITFDLSSGASANPSPQTQKDLARILRDRSLLSSGAIRVFNPATLGSDLTSAAAARNWNLLEPN